MQSHMNHAFSQVPAANIPRSSFDRTHCLKSTFNTGYVIPVYADEALPGDTFNMHATFFARMATPLVPVMDNLRMDCFFFAVPIRLIWNNWQKFNGEQVNPGDSTDYLTPVMTGPNAGAGGVANGTLSDYLGIPTGIPDLTFCSFWHRAYNLIWNEWFRDQNLQNSVTVDKGDGPDTYANYVLKRRGKRHDYLTSALPWPQKGPSVTIPLGAEAPIVSRDSAGNFSRNIYVETAAGNLHSHLQVQTGTNVIQSAAGAPTTSDLRWPYAGQASIEGYNFADLSTATAATINALRQAFQIQKLYERDARGGTRYTEIVRSHFGVISPDARLQRPEYLGGGSTMISYHPVPQTSETATTPQGNLAAFSVATSSGNGFTKSFTEHCVILGLVSVRADLTYQQGLNRMFSRRTRWDFYWPALSHIGEQAVLNKEIYAVGSGGTTDDQVFGYQERYAEYRYKPSQICGRFRSTYGTPLDMWHFAQKFTALPVLGDTFIQENPPVSRTQALPADHSILLDAYFQLKCARPMPVYSVPGLIDHF